MEFEEMTPNGITHLGKKIISYKTHRKVPSYIYLLAGVHGDEKEGVFVLKQLFSYLKSLDHGQQKLNLILIPNLNPDGYEKNTRGNAHNVDLNRNLPSKNWSPQAKEAKYHPGPSPLSEPENQFLISLFETFRPSLVISFHSWKRLLNFNGDCGEIAHFISQYNNYPVEEDIGYPTPGSLGEFMPEKYKGPVLTYELPPVDDNLSYENIWKENAKGLMELFHSTLLNPFLRS